MVDYRPGINRKRGKSNNNEWAGQPFAPRACTNESQYRGVMIGGEGEVEQVTYKDLKFTDVVYRIEDGKVWQYMYVGKSQFFRRDYLMIDAGDEDTFYRIKTPNRISPSS
jgi:hypothetical protein